MRSRRATSTGRPAAGQVELSTLVALVRALPEYLGRRERLGEASFAAVSAPQGPQPPRVRRLDRPGGRIAYRHYRAPGARAALVLIHGSGCFGDLFQRMATEVARRGAAHVFTLDMRGHGLSDGAPGHAMDGPLQAAEDAAAFIDHVRGQLPGVKLVLGGHSAGAGVMLRLAAGAAARGIDGYVFLAPWLGLGAAPNRRQFGGWVRPRLFALAGVIGANLLGVRTQNGRTVLDFARGPARDHRYAPGWSFDTLTAFTPAHRPGRLRLRPDAPVLVLALQDDECFDPARYPDAFADIAPYARIPRLGRGGHWDLLVDARAIGELSRWLVERFGGDPARDARRPASRRAPAPA